jgi:hypothetical protein
MQRCEDPIPRNHRFSQRSRHYRHQKSRGTEAERIKGDTQGVPFNKSHERRAATTAFGMNFSSATVRQK